RATFRRARLPFRPAGPAAGGGPAPWPPRPRPGAAGGGGSRPPGAAPRGRRRGGAVSAGARRAGRRGGGSARRSAAGRGGAAVAAVLGTGLMARAWEADVDGVGLAAAVGAALTFGTYLVLGERLGSRLPSLTTVTYGFAFSALFWLLAVPPQVGDLGGGEWA